MIKIIKTVKYVVFTDEELDAIKSGTDIGAKDKDGNLVIYTSEEKYTKMLISIKEKEFNDD